MTDFTELENPWSRYKLPDGREMRVRHVLSGCVPAGTDNDGYQKYHLQFHAIVVIDPPAELILGEKPEALSLDQELINPKKTKDILGLTEQELFSKQFGEADQEVHNYLITHPSKTVQ